MLINATIKVLDIIETRQTAKAIAKAVKKGQKINTVDTPEGRTYEIIING